MKYNEIQKETQKKYENTEQFFSNSIYKSATVK